MKEFIFIDSQNIFLSSLALVVLSLIFLITAIRIKLTSPGPIFFIQKCLGIKKRRFKIYKFRPIVPDAEKKHAVYSYQKIFHKTIIDELPQLFNVFKGDMSLVGPRPLPIRDYNGFDEDWHRRRFSVRPGITCLWQINGRSDTSFEEWMELDMKYIDKWTLWLDLKILLLTVPAALKGSGAV